MEGYRELMGEACAQLPKGAFLMVEGNPMTIGWAQFGVVWSKPVCTVFVRHSRHNACAAGKERPLHRQRARAGDDGGGAGLLRLTFRTRRG